MNGIFAVVTPEGSISASMARERARRAAEILSRDPRVRLVYLYGSAARGEEAPVGDVDLAILTDRALDAGDLFRLRADLVAAVGVSIDLVSLDRAPIVLAHEVVDAGSCLFARRPEDETDFVVRTRSRWLDFQPFREEQWRLAGERLRERLGP
jgi:predicted nucleotidyltransferase